MKKKILLVVLMVSLFICTFAVTASAATLSDFINVDLTLNDGREVEAYLTKGSYWSGYQGYSRVTIYADYTDTSKTISWSDVKVFDGRNSTIHTYNGTTLTDTGAYAQTLLGYQTETSSVTHFYYPQGSLIVADNSFALAKKWDLEYLYVPKSVKILGTGICNGSTKLTTVEIESGSQLNEIKGTAFADCTSLKSINLQDTPLTKISGTASQDGSAFRGCTSLTSIQFPQTLEYIGYNAFYISGLSGKVVLPNSVTYIGPGAFLATPIETVVIGDGPVTIGYNFMGSFFDNSVSFENTYLKEVYIPSEATFERSSETWRKCTNQVTFYVIGDDCTALINSLKSNGTENHISIGMADDENAETYEGVIVKGYSACKVFYNDEHIISNGACTRCGELYYCNNPEHNWKITGISYESYLSEGVKSTDCLDCDSSPLLTKVPALFTCNGYSAPENGAGGIAVDYNANLDAIAEYERIAKTTISYGLYAVTQNAIGDKYIFDENGNVAAGAIIVDLNKQYTKMTVKLLGFTTDEHKAAKFALGAYVETESAEGKEISYLQSGEVADGYKYAFVSFNDVVNDAMENETTEE